MVTCLKGVLFEYVVAYACVILTIYICVCVCKCAHVCVCASVCVYKCVCTSVCVCVCVCVKFQNVWIEIEIIAVSKLID